MDIAVYVVGSLFGYLLIARGTYGYMKYTRKAIDYVEDYNPSTGRYFKTTEVDLYATKWYRSTLAFLWPVSVTAYLIRILAINAYKLVTSYPE